MFAPPIDINRHLTDEPRLIRPEILKYDLPEMISPLYDEVSRSIMDRAESSDPSKVLCPNVNYDFEGGTTSNGKKISDKRQILPSDLTSERLWLLATGAVDIYGKLSSGMFADLPDIVADRPVRERNREFLVAAGEERLKVKAIQDNVHLVGFRDDEGKLVRCIVHVHEKAPDPAKFFPELADKAAKQEPYQIPDLPFIYKIGDQFFTSAARTYVTLSPDQEHEIAIQEYIPGSECQLTDNELERVKVALAGKIDKYCMDNGFSTNGFLTSNEYVPSNILMVHEGRNISYPEELSVITGVKDHDFIALPIDIPVIRR